MTSMLTSSVVDGGNELPAGQTEDYKIDICWLSTKHTIKEQDQKLIGSGSGECVQVERHVYLQTVVSVS